MVSHYLASAIDALIYATIGGAVGATITWLVARHPLRQLLELLGIHAVHQHQIADALDTDTPGGLTDVLEAIEAVEPHPRPSTRQRP